jgi:hypothetical protein
MSKPKVKLYELVDLIEQHGPVSPNRLTELSGDFRQSVDKYIRQAHDQGLIHIAEFGPSPCGGNRTVKLYVAGKGIDAKRQYAAKKPHVRMSRETRRSRVAARAKAAREARLKSELSRPAYRDELTSAFFGGIAA